MRITHFGHSCLLVETGRARVLIDPGTLATRFEQVRDLDAIVVTHQHPDHLDRDRIAVLATANASAVRYAEPQTAGVLDGLGLPTTALAGGDAAVTIGDLSIEPVGARHAVIHADVPRIDNTGLVLRTEGAPSLYHPGDAIDTRPQGIDLLAVPINAPWCAMKETIDWVRAVGPSAIVPIHGGLLAPPGRAIYLTQIGNLGGVDGQPISILDLEQDGPAAPARDATDQ